MALPACGIYKTTETIAAVSAGHLVYFHNHGNPGPGIYLPESWKMNRAVFHQNGYPLPDDAAAQTLTPLAPEGMYRTADELTCCDKRCMTFPREMLVQLGYNRHAEPILFRPVWSDSGLLLPERGQRVQDDRIARLVRLRVSEDEVQIPTEVLH